jgi:hypothetical protein
MSEFKGYMLKEDIAKEFIKLIQSDDMNDITELVKAKFNFRKENGKANLGGSVASILTMINEKPELLKMLISEYVKSL